MPEHLKIYRYLLNIAETRAQAVAHHVHNAYNPLTLIGEGNLLVTPFSLTTLVDDLFKDEGSDIGT